MCAWRKGGYRDWCSQQEALEAATRLGEESAQWSSEGRPPITDTLSLWLAARYAVATRRIADAEGPEGGKPLRELCADLVELRRGDHSATRLEIERARLRLEQERSEKGLEKKFEEWLLQPDVMKRLFAKGLTPEQRDARIRELFGVAGMRRGITKETRAEMEKELKIL